jgi:hypothetical protein
MKNDPIVAGTDDLSGPLADSVGQIRETPLPTELGRQAMQRAVAYTSPWTPRAVALWSGVAASIITAAFVSGALIIRWTQPAPTPAVAGGAEASVTAAPEAGVANAAAAPAAAPIPTLQTEGEQPIPSFRLSGRRVGAGENPQVAIGELPVAGVQPIPSLPADAKALVDRYQTDLTRFERAKAELEVERAKIESQRASQRAEILAQLNTLAAQYKAAGKSAEGDAVSQQIALLNNMAVASNTFRLTDGALVRTGEGVLVLNANGNVNALPAVAGVAGTPAGADITAFRQSVGQTLQFTAVGSANGTIWGSGVYTDDSPLGVAAVHAGFLKEGERGTLRVTVLPGQASYDSSTKNGITSSTYANWQGSYRIEGKVAPLTVAPATENITRTLTITNAPPTEGRSGRRIQPNPDGTLPAGDAFQGRSGRSSGTARPPQGRVLEATPPNGAVDLPALQLEVRPAPEPTRLPAPPQAPGETPPPPSLPAAR